MQTQIMKFAMLLFLGLASSAWASTRGLPSPPVQEKETVRLAEPRQKPVALPVPARGQLLYENHCMSCHESVVHIRTRQHIRALPELRARVLHWSGYLQLRWGKEEIEDVVNHLNQQFYKFEPR